MQVSGWARFSFVIFRPQGRVVCSSRFFLGWLQLKVTLTWCCHLELLWNSSSCVSILDRVEKVWFVPKLHFIAYRRYVIFLLQMTMPVSRRWTRIGHILFCFRWSNSHLLLRGNSLPISFSLNHSFCILESDVQTIKVRKSRQQCLYLFLRLLSEGEILYCLDYIFVLIQSRNGYRIGFWFEVLF